MEGIGVSTRTMCGLSGSDLDFVCMGQINGECQTCQDDASHTGHTQEPNLTSTWFPLASDAPRAPALTCGAAMHAMLDTHTTSPG
jgi:hypothetical protein